jgi:hypothetical protein
MKSVFILQHVAREGADDEDVKLIGVYSTRQKAQASIARLRRQPGFRECPDGFHIDRYEIDQDCWAEGFGDVAAPAGQRAASRSA